MVLGIVYLFILIYTFIHLCICERDFNYYEKVLLLHFVAVGVFRVSNVGIQ